MTQQFIVGNLPAQAEFAKRNKDFLEHLPVLIELINKVLIPSVTGSTHVQGLIYYLNRNIAEDFFEILILAANGLGIAAKRLLRGMFEKLLTSGYLEKHPDQAERFGQFGELQRLKYLNHKKRIFKVEIVSLEERKRLEDFVANVKGNFVDILCDKHEPKTTRPSFSWTSLSSLAMAEELGFEEWWIDCYFEPTQLIHSTSHAVMNRLTIEGTTVSFDGGTQPKDADRALQLAHALMIFTVSHHDDYFKLGHKAEVEERISDLNRIWPKKDGK